jgi:hypothetical protein
MKNKSNLVEELIQEITSDAGGSMFGGAPGGGAGTFSHTGQKGAQTWAHQSPSMRGTTTTPNPDEISGIIDAEEDEAHMAPPQKPFPLETIYENLVGAYILLGNAESQIKNCLRYNAFISTRRDKKKLLEFLHDKIAGIRQMLKNFTKDIDKITLSN